jgi:hypothetical protein
MRKVLSHLSDSLFLNSLKRREFGGGNPWGFESPFGTVIDLLPL